MSYWDTAFFLRLRVMPSRRMQKIIVSVSPPPLSAFKIPTESPKKKNKKTRPKRSALLFFWL